MTTAKDIKLTIELPVRIHREKIFPQPYTQIGATTFDGRETRAGVPINNAALYLFIDSQLVSVPFESLINLVMPLLLAMPHRDGFIVADIAPVDGNAATNNNTHD